MYQTNNIYLTPDLKMSDIILNNPYLLLLFEHFGIDVPVQDKSLRRICEENNLNTELFLIFANLYNGEQYTPNDPLSFDDSITIISYLKNNHKFYSEEIYPNVLNTIKQMTDANNHDEMALVPRFFIDYFNEVSDHLDYENKVVFPYVLDLHEQIKNLTYNKKKTKYSVDEYKEHHNDIEEKLSDLKSLLIKYLPKEDDQVLRRKLIISLFELEYDLNIHSQIEDLILIPLVAKMESYLNESK